MKRNACQILYYLNVSKNSLTFNPFHPKNRDRSFFFSFLFKEGSKLPLRAHLTDIPLYFRDRTWVTSPLLVKSGKIGCFCWLTPITAHPHRARETVPVQKLRKQEGGSGCHFTRLAPSLIEEGAGAQSKVPRPRLQATLQKDQDKNPTPGPASSRHFTTWLLNPL